VRGIEKRNRFEEMRADRTRLRSALLAKLEAEGEEDFARRLGKCGEPVRLYCTSCAAIKDVESRCDIKWCPSCQPALAVATTARYTNIMGLCQWPLRVTVTVQNYDYGDAGAMRHFRRSFAKIIRQRWFRRVVPGGVVGFEITDLGRGFHVHAHLLVDCEWLAIAVEPPSLRELRHLSPVERKEKWRVIGERACAEIAEVFSRTFGRPASVNVRRVWKKDGGDISAALRETLKYSTKGSDLVKCAFAGRVISQLDATRMVSSFGTFFGKQEVRKVVGAKCPCEECGALGSMLPAAVAEMHIRASRPKLRR